MAKITNKKILKIKIAEMQLVLKTIDEWEIIVGFKLDQTREVYKTKLEKYEFDLKKHFPELYDFN